MNINIFVWITLVLVILYSLGFCISLWKERNKLGAFGVFLLIGGTIIGSIFGLII
ncbi:hypothetical protein [Bacillus sp. FJAT-29937]|uniref:hypothetical protein n=1 Tax=Bacillus sp. FJAT-29937 TaxID=1720553 RepID=UPI000B260E38|nr:hypothetical protein [Bacillus sp. FJAT-29937]